MPILPFFPFFVGTCSPDLLAGKKVPIREMRTASQLWMSQKSSTHWQICPSFTSFLFVQDDRRITFHEIVVYQFFSVLVLYNDSNEITSRSTEHAAMDDMPQAHRSRIFDNWPHKAFIRKWQAANIMPLALETSRLYPSSKGTEPYHVLRIRYLDRSDSHQRRR